MENPPVNRLLQLLRQKPSDPSTAPVTPTLRQKTPKTVKKSSILYAPNGVESSIQHAPIEDKSSILYATLDGKSSTQATTQSNIQPATLPSESSTQRATESGISRPLRSGIQYATPLALSKGQQRTLQFLMANRAVYDPTQTVPIGYDSISRNCYLSRNGSRKAVDELCKKGLIKRIDTKRGETQGSIYHLESSTQYATKNSVLASEESSTQYATLSCSSKEQLLQGLTLEDAFQDLHLRSLLPYLDQFETTEDLQNFLDMANACIAASKDGHGKVIQNPHGFLFAQLKVGYINPPEGYKSRRMRAQERRNQQLEAELTTLRQLKEREHELQFALFKAQLTVEDEQRLEREARAQVKPHLGLSAERQLEVHKDMLLREWFTQRVAP
jgi:hypothetical protein